MTDIFFTSHSLAVELLKHNLTLLGTIRSHRREIPDILREKRRPVESSQFLFDHENNITLVSYISKKKQKRDLIKLLTHRQQNDPVNG